MEKFIKFLVIMIIGGGIVGFLELSGYLYHNDILAELAGYKVHGLDISHHQEKVNWTLVDKKYKFIILKATEGQNFLDTDFLYNWNNARLNGFVVGAYHFFVMTSSGEAQADFYISKVPDSEKTLPPIIDLEISTKKYKKPDVIEHLRVMVEKLEKHYKKRVIFYVNYNTYNAYIKGEFPENKIWITDYKYFPKIDEENRWIIWQVSRRGRIEGIPGFTDKNVLRNGMTVEELINQSKIN
ncbi:GH25 family lysozyme [Leptotrichia sp. oral taxon 879]|uniref:glycoside hydrolase family 25 protein n=1 Tax=Leptotrichia sp. oral taxon 879 TaxID=1227267 RepID=UPI0003AE4FA2|nr:GH25 family lysozyme [Leptotrichia sp. oral taxon 879]ERK48961.1 glycosyl hydrolase family 25 [Leptotrichia sp. oral taxon 879 str. F0557]